MFSRQAHFREIHKNTWLKRIFPETRRILINVKKPELYWVVLCIHNDNEPILEGYSDPKHAVTHAPEWTASLQSTLHISHTLVPVEHEYEFVITLSDEVIRFQTTSWETMKDWVETLRNRLREMRILSPKENLYTKNPEPKALHVSSTRDPMSPLPPPPPIPAEIVPGVELTSSVTSTVPSIVANTSGTIVSVGSSPSTVSITPSHHMTPIDPEEPESLENDNESIASSSTIETTPTARSNTMPENLVNLLTNPIQAYSNKITQISKSNNEIEGCNESTKPVPQITIPRPHTMRNSGIIDQQKVDVQPKIKIHNSMESTSQTEPNDAGPSSNVTIIHVPNKQEIPDPTTNVSHSDLIDENLSESEIRNSYKTDLSHSTTLNVGSTNTEANNNSVKVYLSAAECVTMSSTSTEIQIKHEPNIVKDQTIVIENGQRPPAKENPQTTTIMLNSCNEQGTQTESPISSRHLTRGVTDLNLSSRLDRTIRNLEPQEEESDSSTDVERRSRKEGRDDRRRSASTSDVSLNGRDPKVNPNRNVPQHPSHSKLVQLTLREQQVRHLRSEILHPGGIHLQLKRKSCINALGLVDAFNRVWIAGWKQLSYPLLYNALHIGDQLLTIDGHFVHSSSDANKMIKSSSRLHVDITVRRVPYGRIYGIQREHEGQDLGFVRDKNTAVILDVLPNSIAAKHGIFAKAPTCDGLSLTNWVITEINNRPLNLFTKDNEITLRLNATGRDLSLLIQPLDLITRFKKQLKTLKNYRDYLLQ